MSLFKRRLKVMAQFEIKSSLKLRTRFSALLETVECYIGREIVSFIVTHDRKVSLIFILIRGTTTSLINFRRTEKQRKELVRASFVFSLLKAYRESHLRSSSRHERGKFYVRIMMFVLITLSSEQPRQNETFKQRRHLFLFSPIGPISLAFLADICRFMHEHQGDCCLVLAFTCCIGFHVQLSVLRMSFMAL